MNFLTFYEKSNMLSIGSALNGGSITKPVRRKGAAAQSVGPSPGAKHQNMVRKADKLTSREHPVVASFVGSLGNISDDLNPQQIQSILNTYSITMPNPGEEKHINSNSPVKIRNENGRFYLIK